MHPILNHVLQLQELALIRDEQKVANPGTRLEQLDQSIRTLTTQLPDDTRTHFEKLFRKDHVVIVPMTDGTCAGCGMRLPISLQQQVRMEKEACICPMCARLLYAPDAAMRRIAQQESRLAPRKVGIARFSSPSLMIPALEAATLEAAIGELATRMEHEGFIESAGVMTSEALKREAVFSTVLDHGLAVPHVRGVEGGGLALALGLSPAGLKSAGRALTRIVILIAIPTAASAFYLKLLAGLAETFAREESRKELLAQKDADKVWKVLTKITRATIK